MRISLEWLKDYLPTPVDPSAAADALTHGGFPVENIESHGSDTVLDVEVTSNRGDCLSHVGVGRELSALTAVEFLEPPAHGAGSDQSPAPASPPTSVQIEATDLCPNYTARIIRNVK